MSIGPNDLLAVGTPVAVKNQRGEVVKVETVRDQFGMPISLHTIKFTHRVGSAQSRFRLVELAKPEVRAVNYSFIETQ